MAHAYRQFPLDRLPLALAGFSAALLAAAYAFQYLGGLAPCDLCLKQRIPHWGAVALALAAFTLLRQRKTGHAAIVHALLAAVLAAGAGIAAFHVGVENGWWEGTAACTAQGFEALSPAEFERQLMAAPVVSCDQVAWSLFGISMAGYNFLLSLAAAVVALWGAARLHGMRRAP